MVSASAIAILSAVAVFLFVIVIMVVLTGANIVSAQKAKEKRDILHHWEETLYDSLFHSTPDSPPSETIAKMAVLDIDKYMHNCRIARIEARPKQMIILRLIGAILFLIGCICGLITTQLLFIVVGAVSAILLIAIPAYRIKDKVDRKKRSIEDELPRFLDMLHTALAINIPIESAIDITCQNLKDTTLGKELAATIAEVTVGAGGWQDALEKMAHDYSVDSLSDFTLDLVTAYRNGTSITDSVTRKCRDIKQSNLLLKKERAGKLTNTILFPIMLFKIMPLLLLLCIPMIMQLNQTGFGL